LLEEFESERTIIRYLLGELPAGEQTLFEERYFSDPELLELVLATEDEMINDYLRHRLPPDEREQFESYYLSSRDGREKVQLSEILMKQLDAGDTAISLASAKGARALQLQATSSATQLSPAFLRATAPAMRIALAALLLVAVGGGVWLLVGERRPPVRPERAGSQRAETVDNPPARLPAPATHPGGQAPPRRDEAVALKPAPAPTSNSRPAKKAPRERPITISFALAPGVRRAAGGANTLIIPRNAQTVRLQPSIDTNVGYESYRASLRRVGGAEIWSHKVRNRRPEAGAKPTSVKSVTLSLPASLLKQGDYLLTLTGTMTNGEAEVVGDYPFTITREK
jgi:hypothetical protein